MHYVIIHYYFLAIEIKTTCSTILLVGVYRPPKAAGNDYFSYKLEDELSSLCMWAELQKQTVILMGDLNLNRISHVQYCRTVTDRTFCTNRHYYSRSVC